VIRPIGAPSLKVLFERLQVSDVLAFVTERRREDLTLDFKRAPSNFGNRDERKMLSAAIAGFANSNGGLLVWGIDAREDDERIDCAQSAVPLNDPALFMSRLLEYSGNATSPVVDGIEHRLVEGAGGPFALSFVPSSDIGPHMAKLGEDRYYKRSGDQFRRMEHFDVADMFGRRSRPNLQLFLTPSSSGDGLAVLGLENDGRGGAIAPYIEVTLPAGVKVDQFGLDGAGAFGLLRLPHGGDNAHEPRFGGNRSMVIHPGARHDIAKLRGTVAKGQTYFYAVAAEGLPLTHFEFVVA